MRLDELQRSMIDAIEGGPDHIVPAEYVGGIRSAMRGLRVHANTISHARLVALEESFPRSRERLGEERFNLLSRDFAELDQAKEQPLATIGHGFAEFLDRSGESEAAKLARFEWAWLDTYHAGDAVPLELADFVGLDEDRLLATEVSLHPAARLVTAFEDALLAEEVPDFAEAAAILLTRPQAEVRIGAANPAMAQQFALLAKSQNVCNLLEAGGEPAGEDSLQALFALLSAGALVLAPSSGGKIC